TRPLSGHRALRRGGRRRRLFHRRRLLCARRRRCEGQGGEKKGRPHGAKARTLLEFRWCHNEKGQLRGRQKDAPGGHANGSLFSASLCRAQGRGPDRGAWCSGREVLVCFARASVFAVIRPGGLILLLLVAPRLARGETPITDRNYAFDAHRGAAIADYRQIGMGGVSLATAEGALGLLSNPAAAASRPATANDWFWWDFLFDAYTPSIGVDYDNNGTLQDAFNARSGALNAGLLGMF